MQLENRERSRGEVQSMRSGKLFRRERREFYDLKSRGVCARAHARVRACVLWVSIP